MKPELRNLSSEAELQPQESTCLCLSTAAIAGTPTILGFLHSFWGLNSGLHACSASTSLTEQFSLYRKSLITCCALVELTLNSIKKEKIGLSSAYHLHVENGLEGNISVYAVICQNTTMNRVFSYFAYFVLPSK